MSAVWLGLDGGVVAAMAAQVRAKMQQISDVVVATVPLEDVTVRFVGVDQMEIVVGGGSVGHEYDTSRVRRALAGLSAFQGRA